MATFTKEQIEAKLMNEALNGKARARGAKEDSDEDTSITLDEIEAFGNEESLKEINEGIDSYNLMLQEKITLINDSLTAIVPFTRENLYLFCAFTGSGKTTCATNITFPLWKQKKKVLILSNEESKQDILFRIACLDLGLNFNAFKKGLMSMEDQGRVKALFTDIVQYVKILDVTWGNGFTTKLESVQGALEAVKKENYSCVLIDYYQLIKYSIKDPSKSTFSVLEDLKIYLGRYVKGSNCPVVLFAQLHSIGKRGGVTEIDARIKDCPAVCEPATVIIEMVPDYEHETTQFILRKDRFGNTGKYVTCPFEKGRFLNHMDTKQLAERKMEKLSHVLAASNNKSETKSDENDSSLP